MVGFDRDSSESAAALAAADDRHNNDAGGTIENVSSASLIVVGPTLVEKSVVSENLFLQQNIYFSNFSLPFICLTSVATLHPGQNRLQCSFKVFIQPSIGMTELRAKVSALMAKGFKRGDVANR